MIDDRLGPGWLQLTIGGQHVPSDKVGPVSIRHGRVDVDGNPAPGTATVTVDRAALGALPTVGDALTVQLSDDALTALGATAEQADAARVRFAGDLTDARLEPRTTAGQALLTLVAVAPAARLGRDVIGDTPWPAETDGERAGRILARCAALMGVTVGTVDPGTATLLPRDVDRQRPDGLLDELATASGGQLHLARNGALSWWDAEHRRNSPAVVELTAANVLRATGWRLDLAGVVNDVTITYGPQLLDEEGQPLDPDQLTERVVDAVARQRYGQAAARLVTQLAEQADAAERARQLVGRRSRPRWRIDALTVELLRTLSPSQSVALLTAEPGALLGVTGFPDTGPAVRAQLFVEGWTEDCSRYGWTVALDVVDYATAGAAPRWADVNPRTRWADVPPDLTWQQAVGWHTEADLGRWLDQPSSQRWANVPPTRRWADYPTPA